MAYLGKLSPTVGNGLGGMPERIVCKTPTVCPSVPIIPRYFAHGTDSSSIAINMLSSITGLFNGTKNQKKVNAISPSANLRSTSMSSGAGTLVVTGSATPWMAVYKNVDNVFTQLVIDTNPSKVCNVSAITKDGVYIAVGEAGTSLSACKIYKRNGDSINLLTSLLGTYSTNIEELTFSGDDTILYMTFDVSPFFKMFKRAGDTFTDITSIDIAPTANPFSMSVSADGTYLTMGVGYSPFILFYKNINGTMTKLSNPATLPTGYVSGCAMSTNGIYVACSDQNTNTKIYKRTGDAFAWLQDLTSVSATSLVFSPDTDMTDSIALATKHNSTPYFKMWNRDGDAFTDTLVSGNGALVPSTQAIFGLSFSR